jgi:uncharacterized membrane protein (DUF106 family)
MGDLKTKGKDIVEPQLENIKNQFVPMKIWVRFKLISFIILNISIERHNYKGKTFIIYRLRICQKSGIWKRKMSSRRLL